jgi:hypothetical protein
MSKLISALIAAVLAALPIFAAAQPAKPALDAQVHCAVVFGLVAREQNNRRPGASRFPAMDEPGKAFFVATGMRVLDEGKVTIDQIEPYFIARVAEVDDTIAASPDPAKALDAEYAKCVPLFAQVVPEAPPLVK